MSTGTTAAATFALSAVLSFLAWLGLHFFDLNSDSVTGWIVFELHVFFLVGAILGPLVYLVVKTVSRPWLIGLLVLGLILVITGSWDLYRNQYMPVIFGYGLVFFPAAALVTGATVNLMQSKKKITNKDKESMMTDGKSMASIIGVCAPVGVLILIAHHMFTPESPVLGWIFGSAGRFFLAAAFLGPVIYVALLHSTRTWLITLLTLGAILVIAGRWYSYLAQDIGFPGYGVVFYPAAGLVGGAAVNLFNRRPRS